MSRPFPAKYPGRCAADCGQRIDVDEPVVYVGDHLVHEDCSGIEAPPPLGAGRVVAPCASCHLVHAGECF